MKKLNVNYMYLEITRRCTLECAHCLRGDRQNVDMSEKTIDNVLRDVTHIRELDLGGGEPLIVPHIIENIISKIKTYGISIDKISFTTNGTILTQEVISIIRKLQEIAQLDVRLSHDKFHLLELYAKGKFECFEQNNKLLTELLGYDPKDKNFVMDNGVIGYIGRAKKLSQKALDFINSWREPTFYRLSPLEKPNISDVVRMYDWDKDVVWVSGSVVISATGYLTQLDMEYETEDKEPIFGINVNDESLLEVLAQYERKHGSFLIMEGDQEGLRTSRK